MARRRRRPGPSTAQRPPPSSGQRRSWRLWMIGPLAAVLLAILVISDKDLPDPWPALHGLPADDELPLDSPDEMPPWRRSDAIRRWHQGFSSSKILNIIDDHLLAPEMPLHKTEEISWPSNGKRATLETFVCIVPVSRNICSLHLPADFADTSAPWKVYYMLHPASVANETHRLVELINRKWSHNGTLIDDIRAAAKFGLVFEAIHPYQQGNERVVRAVIADMLYDRLGFALAMPQSDDLRTSHGKFHWVFTIAKSARPRRVLNLWADKSPRNLPPVLNSSLYGAFLLDCILDQVLELDIDAPSAAAAAAV